MPSAQIQQAQAASDKIASGFVFALLGAVGFSAKAIIVKLAYRHGTDAVTLLMYRMLFALPLFVLMAWWAGRGRPRLTGRERLGVLLQPGDQLDVIAGLLDTLSLVALAFPAYNDGRSYSKAELLRSRHGFKGAVRAVGDVLYDQLSHMLRVGFDEFVIANPVLSGRLEEGKTGGLPLHYQPAARSSGATGAYSWRRAGQGRV